eukprot:Em0016g60a
MGDRQIPPDVLFLLKSVRVFGHFEKPLFMTLCKHVETKFVPAGALLFRPGQVDDSIYVVKSGRLSVFIVEQDGSELPLKAVGMGESVHSMLSILDSVVESPKLFKSVAARAVRDTYVLQYVANSYSDIEHWLNLGNRFRATAATGMNDRSSRSHAVFTILLTQTMVCVHVVFLLHHITPLYDGEEEHSKVSRINLIDLAGSERSTVAQTCGDRLKYAQQARSIVNVARINEDPNAQVIESFGKR